MLSVQDNSNQEELQEKFLSKEESSTFHVELCTLVSSIIKEIFSLVVPMNMEN